MADAATTGAPSKAKKGGQGALAYDPWIQFPDGDKVLLSTIVNQRETRKRYLEPFYRHATAQVRCMCRHDGIVLGIGRRTTPEEIYYFYPLHRADPLLHALRCPHHVHAQPKEEGDEAQAEVVEVHGTRIHVRLRDPMRKLPPRPGREPDEDDNVAAGEEDGATDLAIDVEEPGPLEPDEDVEQDGEDVYMGEQTAPPPRPKPPPQGDLRVLLDVLWSEAELNHWSPGFKGVRTYNVVRQRLLAAADQVDVKGTGIRPLLYIPPRYAPATKEECSAEWKRFTAILAPDKKGRSWFGFALGALKTIERPREDAVCVHLSHAPRGLWMTSKPWNRRAKYWFGTNNDEALVDDHNLLLLLRVRRVEGKSGPWLQIEDFTGFAVEDHRTWLLTRGGYDSLVLSRLLEDGRHFVRPMAHGQAGVPAPSFVLLDRADRMALEIVPPLLARTERENWRLERVGAYETAGQPVWWWDVATEASLPEIPTAD